MKRFLTMCAALAVMGVASVSAQAGWVPLANGNSQFGPPSDPADGIVSFAVWETGANTDWVTELGLGSVVSPLMGTVDTDAAFVYFYQVTNNNPSGELNDHSLSLLMVPESAPGVYTSAGYLAGTVFDDGSPVGPTTNIALGTDVSPADVTGDETPSVYQVPVGFAAGTVGAGAKAPTGAQVVNDLLPPHDPYLQFTLNLLGPDQYTTVMFATSNNSPVYKIGQLQDGLRAGGDVPAPTPVPAGLALLFTGLPGVLGLCFWRRKQEVVA